MIKPDYSRSGLRFSKMHGLGNDFVLVDCRTQPLALNPAEIQRLGDRHLGVGFDQLLTIELANDPACAFGYRIWNADGSPAGQCGNGVRCVAAWLQRAGLLVENRVQLESPSGIVTLEILPDCHVRVEMGEPHFLPAEIPLQGVAEQDTYITSINGRVIEFGAVSFGNPHAVIEVNDVAAAPVAQLGAAIENIELFPERCNVGFVQVCSPTQLVLRVWERGAGETQACGSGACAAMVILRRRGKVAANVEVTLPGGTLSIQWNGPGHSVWMTGPATFVFDGNYRYEGEAR